MAEKIRELRIGPTNTPRDVFIALKDVEERVNALIRAYIPLDTEVVSWDDILGKPDTFIPNEHNHDDRYYTEEQIELLFEELDVEVTWAAVTDKPLTFPPSLHAHPWSQITDMPVMSIGFRKADGTSHPIPVNIGA